MTMYGQLFRLIQSKYPNNSNLTKNKKEGRGAFHKIINLQISAIPDYQPFDFSRLRIVEIVDLLATVPRNSAQRPSPLQGFAYGCPKGMIRSGEKTICERGTHQPHPLAVLAPRPHEAVASHRRKTVSNHSRGDRRKSVRTSRAALEFTAATLSTLSCPSAGPFLFSRWCCTVDSHGHFRPGTTRPLGCPFVGRSPYRCIRITLI